MVFLTAACAVAPPPTTTYAPTFNLATPRHATILSARSPLPLPIDFRSPWPEPESACVAEPEPSQSPSQRALTPASLYPPCSCSACTTTGRSSSSASCGPGSTCTSLLPSVTAQGQSVRPGRPQPHSPPRPCLGTPHTREGGSALSLYVWKRCWGHTRWTARGGVLSG